ncbi:ImmA/IrrE family metallo-endopeptidase [Nocardiopsis alba]|uniref:ImmA/IrrE family metallo-endopeptidase n=1 Tax=Nocardiopsis alba TaxID=53437 RepID=UPI0033E57141
MAVPKFTKAYAKLLAEEEREELGCHPFRPLDPYELAEHHGVRVLSLADIASEGGVLLDAHTHFTVNRPDAFSGALLPIGTGHAIVVNSAHSRERLRSTVAHELAHILLEHSFTTTFHLSGKCRQSDVKQEAQADELSGELLVPHKAAFRAARQQRTDEWVASTFDVSIEFARWRMNATGARKVAARAQAKAARAISRP